MGLARSSAARLLMGLQTKMQKQAFSFLKTQVGKDLLQAQLWLLEGLRSGRARDINSLSQGPLHRLQERAKKDKQDGNPTLFITSS